MRGFLFTLYATGALILTLVVLGAALHFAEALPSGAPSQLGGRIGAALTFLSWEYRGDRQVFGSFDTSKGCVPVVVLNLRDDPVEHLAKPIIFYRCG